MEDDIPRWGVVATVDEPPELIEAFVAWHLAQGASEVFVFFDKPGNPALSRIAHLPKVRVQSCTDDYWGQFKHGRPDRHEIRQARNATRAYRKTTCDWLFHCDADEFLWVAEGSVSQSLNELPGHADCAVVPVAERIHPPGHSPANIFAGPFRLVDRTKTDPVLSGPTPDLRLRGLSGHILGKAFTRIGKRAEISIHRPRAMKDSPDLDVVQSTDLMLLHFDGLTPLHWICKLLRMAEAMERTRGRGPSAHSLRQIEWLLTDIAQGFMLYDTLKRYDEKSLALLDRNGLLLRVDMPKALAAKTMVPVLTTPAFDRELRVMHGPLLARYGVVATNPK